MAVNRQKDKRELFTLPHQKFHIKIQFIKDEKTIYIDYLLSYGIINQCSNTTNSEV